MNYKIATIALALCLMAVLVYFALLPMVLSYVQSYYEEVTIDKIVNTINQLGALRYQVGDDYLICSLESKLPK
jgi:Sec-independent protein secretion pathway component TatC